MRVLFVLLLAFALPVDAAVVRLSQCGTLPTTISESQPFDLDGCPIREGDEILELLKDVYARWGAVYVRAPSKTVSVTSTGTYAWPSGVRFVLSEDQGSSNKFTINHSPTSNVFNMWDFTNAHNVRIGGPNLSITFVGTHPGLGQGAAGELQGLLEFNLTNGTSPDLVDIRANFWKTLSQGIVFIGGTGGTSNRWKQLNVAGVFMSSGVQVNSGVQNIWLDPDRTVIMDPWNRAQGWDGVIATTVSGVPVGCTDKARQEARNGPRAEFFRFQSLTGGVTSEYGTPIFNLFLPGTIGTGDASRYVVRYKDYGASGPSELTGYPSGVTVKHGVSTGLMKHDPAWEYDASGGYKRWLKFQKLPDTYRTGLYAGQITSGCAAGTSSNAIYSGTPFIWRAEASRDGVSAQYITFGFDVEFAGTTANWFGVDSSRPYIEAAGSGADISPGPAIPDRTYGHILRAATATRVPGVTKMLDTNTATGPGSWYQLSISPASTDQGTTIYPNDNTVKDTQVHGSIVVGANATNTTVANVDFRGDAARAIMSVGSGSAVTVSKICARAGSTITGAGTVLYNGATWKSAGSPATYTVLTDMNDCLVGAGSVPVPPQDVVAE